MASATYNHDGKVMCCAMSGDLVAVGDDANKLIVRNLKTGELVHSFDLDSEVACCAMLGDLVAAGDGAKKLIVRDLKTGEVVHAFYHGRNVACCALLGEELLAAGDDANKLIVRNLRTGKILHAFDHDGRVRSCAMSGALVAAGDSARNLIVRSLKTGEVIHAFDHDNSVGCCTMLGDLIVAGDRAKKLTVRSLKTGDVLHTFDHDGAVRCCALLGGDLIAAGDQASKLIVRNLKTGDVVHSFDHEHAIWCCAASGGLLAAGDWANTLIVRNLKIGEVANVFNHPDKIWCCATSGDMIAAGDAANNLIVRNLTTGEVVHAFDHHGKVSCCATSGDVMAAGGWTNELIVRSLKTGKSVHVFNHDGRVWCCAVSGDLIAAGDQARNLIVRSLKTGDVLHTFDHDGNIRCCALLGDKLIAAGDAANKLIVRSLKTGKVVHALSHDDTVRCCAMSGNLLAAGDEANKLIVRNLKTGKILHAFDHDGRVRSCAMSEALVAAGDSANKLIVRNLKTGEVIHAFDHDSSIGCCIMLGDLIAAGDDTGKLIVRDLKTTGILDPLPDEIPFGAAQQQVRCRPHLLHRRGISHAIETTLLHRLANATEAELPAPKLAAILCAVLEHNSDHPTSQPFALVPVPDESGYTPLDLAMKAGNHAKVKVLAEAYARSAVAWRAASTALSRSLKTMCARFPDLITVLLDAAYLDGPVQHFTGNRVPRAELPVFRPHHSFHGVDWRQELLALTGNVGRGNCVEVASHVAGMCGLLTLDGPFNDITLTRSLSAFETRAMSAAVEFKWRTYGQWVHLGQLLVYLTGVVFFFGAQIALKFEAAHTSRGLMLAAAVATVVLLLAEMTQMILQVKGKSVATSLARHFRDRWNMLELACYSLMLASAVEVVLLDDRHDQPVPVLVAALCGCTNVVATFNLFTFLRPYRAFAALIQMVLQIFQDMFAFLMGMAVLLVGFSMAFTMMLPDQPRFQLPTAFLASFEMMLGAWDLEQLNGYDDMHEINRLTVLSVIAFVLFAVLVVLVAMNLLIAIMGDSYDRVRENQVVHGRIQRAETLVAMEWFVRCLGRRKCAFRLSCTC